MDEVVTEQLTIEYNGGCRPLINCTRGPAFGKRDGALIACSRCCDNKMIPECNTKLCGIKSSPSNQCYHCNRDDDAGVSDPNQCTNIVSCQSDEVCAAETYSFPTHDTYQFKCMSKQLCTLLTIESLKRLEECRVANPDPVACGPLGKRDSSGLKKCIACCGDTMCNNDTCENILDRLYNLWKAGVHDFDTLKQNGTLPSTTSAAG